MCWRMSPGMMAGWRGMSGSGKRSSSSGVTETEAELAVVVACGGFFVVVQMSRGSSVVVGFGLGLGLLGRVVVQKARGSSRSGVPSSEAGVFSVL